MKGWIRIVAVAILCVCASVASADEVDVVQTRDGGMHYGKVLREMDTGLLFRPAKGTPYLIRYAEVLNVRTLSEMPEGEDIRLERPTEALLKTPPAKAPAAQPEAAVAAAPPAVRRTAPAPRPAASRGKKKSAELGFFFSLIVPGAGHYYRGDKVWGTTYLLTSLVGTGILVGIASDSDGPSGAELGAGEFALLGSLLGLRVIDAVHAAGAINSSNKAWDEAAARRGLTLRSIGYLPVAPRDGGGHGVGAAFGF